MTRRGLQNEDDVLREALDALHQLDQDKLRRWHEGNELAIEQSRRGLSKPLDLESVLARVEERLLTHPHEQLMAQCAFGLPLAILELEDILFYIRVVDGRPETSRRIGEEAFATSSIRMQMKVAQWQKHPLAAERLVVSEVQSAGLFSTGRIRQVLK